MKVYNTLDDINSLVKGTLMETLQIQYTEFENEYLTAEMPVNSATHQPYKTLHGGATVALAESVGSALSFLCVDNSKNIAVGVEINANHLRQVKDGKVKATARFLFKGDSIHVIDIQIQDEQKRLIAVCRLTNKILKK
jgi:1,4-dihydroxy-2-naphthoyl-CoA hydrolase